MKDTILYEKLGISPYISHEDLKKEGKKLLLKWHPDKNENKEESSEKFIEIKEILDILTNPDKRILYHRIGIDILNSNNSISPMNSTTSPIHPNTMPPMPFFKDFNNLFNNFSSMFNMFNNHNISSNDYDKDILFTITIKRSFLREEESYNVSYKRNIICEECYCSLCNNKGFIEENIVIQNIMSIIRKNCTCKNVSSLSLCSSCNGRKYKEEQNKVIVTIKSEKLFELIDNKQTIILKGRGNILKDKTTDLVIVFRELEN